VRAGSSGIVRPVKRRLDPGLFLLLTPVLWGASFPATKIVLRHVAVLPFMFWTRTLGFVTILAWVPFARGRSATRDEARRALLPGAILGALMVVGFSLQTAGIARTTATNAGFITGLYVVLTPLLGAVAFRHTVARSAWFAVAVSIVGLALLSIADLGHVRLHAGDLLVLAGAVAWAGHITAVGHFSPRHPARVLALAQMGFAALLHLALAAPGGLRPGHVVEASVWPLLIVTGVLGSGVAFTIQVVAQRTLTPSRAVVLLAGEAIVSAAASAVWIGERLEAHQWVGAALVIAAMALSEVSARRADAPPFEPAAVP
jgi:drug/metabolite transporter (DMT)-like permease